MATTPKKTTMAAWLCCHLLGIELSLGQEKTDATAWLQQALLVARKQRQQAVSQLGQLSEQNT